ETDDSGNGDRSLLSPLINPGNPLHERVSIHLLLTNQCPGSTTTGATSPYLIKTDVSVQPHSLRDAILGIGDEPENIQRIELVEINGQSGLRVWEESEGWDFPNSLITYVPIGDREIAYIVSFYSSENQAAEDAIIQMHNTLRLFSE
ncbi:MULTISPECIES: hypothetical protein, partial [Cyanophyceae]|uniref:hypothetical protein n=1 Tax=Cyanophyceae TaxID=3028117 RepID=UPI001A7EBBC7